MTQNTYKLPSEIYKLEIFCTIETVQLWQKLKPTGANYTAGTFLRHLLKIEEYRVTNKVKLTIPAEADNIAVELNYNTLPPILNHPVRLITNRPPIVYGARPPNATPSGATQTFNVTSQIRANLPRFQLTSTPPRPIAPSNGAYGFSPAAPRYMTYGVSNSLQKPTVVSVPTRNFGSISELSRSSPVVSNENSSDNAELINPVTDDEAMDDGGGGEKGDMEEIVIEPDLSYMNMDSGDENSTPPADIQDALPVALNEFVVDAPLVQNVPFPSYTEERNKKSLPRIIARKENATEEPRNNFVAEYSNFLGATNKNSVVIPLSTHSNILMDKLNTDKPLMIQSSSGVSFHNLPPVAQPKSYLKASLKSGLPSGMKPLLPKPPKPFAADGDPADNSNLSVFQQMQVVSNQFRHLYNDHGYNNYSWLNKAGQSETKSSDGKVYKLTKPEDKEKKQRQTRKRKRQPFVFPAEAVSVSLVDILSREDNGLELIEEGCYKIKSYGWSWREAPFVRKQLRREGGKKVLRKAKLYICMCCPKVYGIVEYLYNHSSKHVFESPSTVHNTGEGMEGHIACPLCGGFQRFKNHYRLKMHLKSHRCTICNEVFATVNERKEHMDKCSRVGNSNKLKMANKVCWVCNKKRDDLGNCLCDQKEPEPETKDYKCHACPEEYTTLDQLTKHLYDHQVNPHLLKCSKCSSIGQHVLDMWRHFRICGEQPKSSSDLDKLESSDVEIETESEDDSDDSAPARRGGYNVQVLGSSSSDESDSEDEKVVVKSESKVNGVDAPLGSISPGLSGSVKVELPLAQDSDGSVEFM